MIGLYSFRSQRVSDESKAIISHSLLTCYTPIWFKIKIRNSTSAELAAVPSTKRWQFKCFLFHWIFTAHPIVSNEFKITTQPVRFKEWNKIRLAAVRWISAMKCEWVRLDVGCRLASIYRVLFVSDRIIVDRIIVVCTFVFQFVYLFIYFFFFRSPTSELKIDLYCVHGVRIRKRNGNMYEWMCIDMRRTYLYFDVDLNVWINDIGRSSHSSFT